MEEGLAGGKGLLLIGGGLRKLKPLQITGSEFHVETSAPHSQVHKESKFKVKAFCFKELGASQQNQQNWQDACGSLEKVQNQSHISLI